jgi:TolB protein
LLVSSATGDTTAVLVIPNVTWAVHSPAWSPDGRRVAYVHGNDTWRTSFNVSATSIWIVAADGGEPVRVTGDEFMDVSPVWLDDDHLLFVSDRDGPREVYVIDVGRAGARGEPRKVPGIIDPHSIAYSAAGGILAFARGSERQNIWSFPLGAGARSLADLQPVTDDNAVIEDHHVSPDGRKIAYASNLRGSMDIWVRPLDGGSPMPLTTLPGDEFGPHWSPDGTEIAFYGDLSAEEGAVWVVSAQGGNPVLLTSGREFNNTVRWSPDGLHLAFRSHRTGRAEVWLLSRDNVVGPWSEPRQVTDFGCYIVEWEPDGEALSCRSSEEGWVVVSPRGDIVRRYPWPSGLGIRGFRRYSPDKSSFYFVGSHEDGRHGIWAYVRRTGEATLVMPVDESEYHRVLGAISVGTDRLYVTLGEWATDIWVADVEVER